MHPSNPPIIRRNANDFVPTILLDETPALFSPKRRVTDDRLEEVCDDTCPAVIACARAKALCVSFSRLFLTCNSPIVETVETRKSSETSHVFSFAANKTRIFCSSNVLQFSNRFCAKSVSTSRHTAVSSPARNRRNSPRSRSAVSRADRISRHSAAFWQKVSAAVSCAATSSRSSSAEIDASSDSRGAASLARNR